MTRYLSASLDVVAEQTGTSRIGTLLRGLALAVLGSMAVALAAHVTVPLPWTPVPLTLQPMAVLLVGLLFGPTLGFATLALYLGEGAMGLPVFQPHGPGGVLQLLGPTGGFLWSYPVVALVAGAVYRTVRFRSRYSAAVAACGCAVAVLYTSGAAQFAVLTHLDARAVLLATVVPFLTGELLKVLVASGFAATWTSRSKLST